MNTLSDLDAQFDPSWNLLLQPAQTPGYHTRIADGTPTHPQRQSMDYALLCLEEGSPDRVTRATKVIEAVLSRQVTDPLEKHFGIWGWFAEEMPQQMNPADWNWADFIGARLAQMLGQHAGKLDPTLQTRMRDALERAAMCIFRRQSPVAYTNIAIMGAAVCAAAGELLGRPILLEYGRRKLQAVLDLAREVGTFSEYNSPTYTIVAIDECERALLVTRDAEVHAIARSLLEVAWGMVAEHWHPATQQWAGPHGRAYTDLLSDDTRNRIINTLGERAKRPITEPRMITSALGGKVDGVEKVAHTWLAPTYCISSVTREFTWTQRRQILGYWNAGASVAVFKVQFLMDAREMPSMRFATSHVENRILLTAYPLHGCGPWHPHFDVPPRSTFTPSDLRLRFRLEAPDARAVELAPGRFDLSAGGHRVRLDVSPVEFDGRPVRWSMHQEPGLAAVDAVLATGQQPVCFETLKLRLAAGIQILQPNATPVVASILLTDEGSTRRVAWDGVPDLVVPTASMPLSW